MLNRKDITEEPRRQLIQCLTLWQDQQSFYSMSSYTSQSSGFFGERLLEPNRLG